MADTHSSQADDGSDEGVPESPYAVAPYRAVFEAAPDGIILVDGRGRIRDANPKAEALFGYGRDELIGQPVEMLVPEAARGRHARDRSGFVDDPLARPMGIGLELRGRRRDGDTFPVEISLSPLRTSDGLLVISTIRDVTQRRRLRQFGFGALRAAEEERRRIARELHDDTAQRLAAILLRLRLLSAERTGPDRDRLLEEVRSELREAAEAVRRIARGLRPPALEDAGVAAAIRAHVRARLSDGGPEIDLDLAPVDDVLDEEAKLVLYRIVQEALSNVLRHARASKVDVRVQRSADQVVAEVRDDGRGFDPRVSPREDGRGLGLMGMRERATLVGGRVSVESEPGAGTRIRLEVPLRQGGAT